MLSVPFPVLTLLALLLLLARALYPLKQRHNGTLYFLIACIVLISVSTLRWEYDSTLLRNIQSVLAMLLPPVAWHSFISMTQISSKRYWQWLLLPVTVSLCLRFLWPATTDFLLILLFAGYGLSLLHIALQGEYRFALNRLGELSQTTKMAFLAGGFLCLSALTDLIIVFDFGLNGGKLAPTVIVIAQTTLLPFIGAAIFCAGRTTARTHISEELPETPSAQPAEAAVALYEVLEKQLRESQIYLNPDLTLTVLARKTGIPARHLSGAVNAVTQGNISQWINGFRIEKAKALLLSTPLPVTEIMLECGFTTKSNFNREFQRITGVSPTVFRQQGRDSLAMN